MKSLRLYIIILSALLVIYLVVQFNRPKAIDWSATFSSADKIPFGTYIAYNRLNDIFPDARIESFREPVYNVLNDHGITRGAYIIICDEPTLNEYDYQKLLDFIKAGNDVFIAAEAFGDEIEKRLKIEMGHEFPDFKSTVGLKFTSKHLDTNKIYQISRSIGLNYFRRFNHDTAVVLGMSAKHHPNFLKYPLGKGNLYLNADPLMFTNFGLLQKTSSDYAETALSYINPINYVIWDQYYAIGREGDDSSIRVFLRSAALRWAFYSAFFGLVVFVLYDIKRRQRIIPVIEPLRNDTLTFVSTVGQVYYEEHNNMNLASKKILYFLEYLRDKYNLKTTTLNKEFTDGLAQKTGIDKEFAANLVNYINYLAGQQTNVTNDELIELNRFIEQFYIKSR